MSEHEHFEELCALSASDAISSSELSELQTHLKDCAHCREHLTAFAQVSAQALAVHGEDYARPPVPAGMTERFIARAQAEGIPLRGTSKIGAAVGDYVFGKAAALALASLVLVVSSGLLLRQMASKHSPAAGNIHFVASASTSAAAISTSSTSADSELLARLRDQLDLLTRGNRSLAKDKQAVEQEKAALDKENSELEKHDNALKRQLADSELQANDLAARIAGLEKEDSVLRQQDAKIAELSGELKKKDAALTDEIATLAEQQNQLEDVRAQLGERAVEVKEQQRLLAAGSQVRDLITARNLHIIDVHDANGSGEHQRTFGRIFYTEGKSLVFYAYDLQGSGDLNSKVAFHVWGSRLGDQQQALKLGIFRSENSGEGRWVLTCDDAKVLARINTVFVTAESSRNSLDQPKGRRILYAFLGERANHP